MTWTKLSDDFTDDCWTLSDAAFRLHTEALVWNNRKLLDLVIPKADVPRFSQRPDAVSELLVTGWWIETPAAYVLRHHATYQRTREQVLKQQEVNQRNGAKGGRPPVPKSARETESVSDSVSDSLTERDRTGQAWIEDEFSEQIDVETGEVKWPAVAAVPDVVEVSHPRCPAEGCENNLWGPELGWGRCRDHRGVAVG